MSEPIKVELDPKRGLVIKLCEIMGAVGYLQKRGQNETQRYKYATEADVAEMVRGEFSKRNIFVFPNVVKNERVKLTRSKTYKDVIEEKVTYATDIEVEWTFVDGDTGQERTVKIPGCSESPGDKGIYVAMTGSEKYLIMKSFFIPTGDDPENDNNETDGKGTHEAAQAVGKAKIEALKASKALPDPSQGPDQLTVLQMGDEYEVAGDPDVMNRHKELLLGVGRRVGKAVVMNADGLNAFQYQFVEKRGGILTNLKPTKG